MEKAQQRLDFFDSLQQDWHVQSCFAVNDSISLFAMPGYILLPWLNRFSEQSHSLPCPPVQPPPLWG